MFKIRLLKSSKNLVSLLDRVICKSVNILNAIVYRALIYEVTLQTTLCRANIGVVYFQSFPSILESRRVSESKTSYTSTSFA